MSRLCKHLMAALNRQGAFANEDAWIRAMADNGYGGQLSVFVLSREDIQDVLIAAGNSDAWLDVYSPSKRKVGNAYRPDGVMTVYGWSIFEKRWADRFYPPNAAKLREFLETIESMDRY